MSERKLFTLLNQLWSDFNTPEFYWLLAALVAILGISWWIAFRLRHNGDMHGAGERNALLAFGAGSLKRRFRHRRRLPCPLRGSSKGRRQRFVLPPTSRPQGVAVNRVGLSAC